MIKTKKHRRPVRGSRWERRINMKMTDKEYREFAEKRAPRSPDRRNLVRAFVVGGTICLVGQLFMNLYLSMGLERDTASAFCSISLVFIGALLTGIGVYDDIARIGGAGTLVPITGFANSVAAPALEFKTEGFVTGTAVKMFSIAGPVIVYGTAASVVYGFIYWLCNLI